MISFQLCCGSIVLLVGLTFALLPEIFGELMELRRESRERYAQKVIFEVFPFFKPIVPDSISLEEIPFLGRLLGIPLCFIGLVLLAKTDPAFGGRSYWGTLLIPLTAFVIILRAFKVEAAPIRQRLIAGSILISSVLFVYGFLGIRAGDRLIVLVSAVVIVAILGVLVAAYRAEQ